MHRFSLSLSNFLNLKFFFKALLNSLSFILSPFSKYHCTLDPHFFSSQVTNTRGVHFDCNDASYFLGKSHETGTLKFGSFLIDSLALNPLHRNAGQFYPIFFIWPKQFVYFLKPPTLSIDLYSFPHRF